MDARYGEIVHKPVLPTVKVTESGGGDGGDGEGAGGDGGEITDELHSAFECVLEQCPNFSFGSWSDRHNLQYPFECPSVRRKYQAPFVAFAMTAASQHSDAVWTWVILIGSSGP